MVIAAGGLDEDAGSPESSVVAAAVVAAACVAVAERQVSVGGR